MNYPTENDLRYLKQFIGKRIASVEFTQIQHGATPTLTFDDGTFAQIWTDKAAAGRDVSGGVIELYDENGTEMLPADWKPYDETPLKSN